MGAQGTATINFGAFPGATDATVAVTGQAGILAGSLVEAWILPAATADHSADEHWVDPPQITAGNVVAGTGFTIYGKVREGDGVGDRRANSARVYGQWNVAWVWN